MPNALAASFGGSPPAPNPNPQPPMQGGGNALLGAIGGAPASAPTPAPFVPAPNSQQTVAALRHFGALERELTTLLDDPDTGKTDVHSKIIDGMTKLVADNIMQASNAVQQLGTVPERPFEQKEWLQNHLAKIVQARQAILEHHAAAFHGQQPTGQAYNPDDHTNIMSGLMSHYQQGTPQSAG